MENIKASYETMFIVETTKGEEKVAAVVAKFKALIEANGEVESFNEWGKRKLAYPINPPKKPKKKLLSSQINLKKNLWRH